jgi:peptidoglycan/LPS O-acetylase OafA/YrhL
MYPLRSGTEWWQFLSHVFAVHNFGSETYAGINPSFWSIAVEVQLYLIYPLLLALVRKIGWEKTLIATMVLELFIRGTMMISDISSAIILPQVITASPLTFWFSWALGAYVSDCYKNSRASVINKINFSWVVVLSFLSAYCRPLTQFTFTLVAVSTAIFLNNQLEKKSNMPKGMLVKALEEHFSLLGLFSYGFYLFHQPLVAQSYSLMGFLFPQNFIPSFLMFWIMLLWYPLILISSSFMFKFVEKPMSQLGC